MKALAGRGELPIGLCAIVGPFETRSWFSGLLPVNLIPLEV
jgi:hypothetical protein